MSIQIDALRPTDWEAVRRIYEEGIATGDAGHAPTACLLSPLSTRAYDTSTNISPSGTTRTRSLLIASGYDAIASSSASIASPTPVL